MRTLYKHWNKGLNAGDGCDNRKEVILRSWPSSASGSRRPVSDGSTAPKRAGPGQTSSRGTTSWIWRTTTW